MPQAATNGIEWLHSAFVFIRCTLGCIVYCINSSYSKYSLLKKASETWILLYRTDVVVTSLFTLLQRTHTCIHRHRAPASTAIVHPYQPRSLTRHLPQSDDWQKWEITTDRSVKTWKGNGGRGGGCRRELIWVEGESYRLTNWKCLKTGVSHTYTIGLSHTPIIGVTQTCFEATSVYKLNNRKNGWNFCSFTWGWYYFIQVSDVPMFFI